ncbi:amino acid ABC transporter, substrate-binding protein, partial [Rhizobium sp. Pop5]
MINLRGIAAFLTLLVAAARGHAAGVTIGVVAPQGGPLALLGAQI